MKTIGELFRGYADTRFGESRANPLRRVRADVLLGSFGGDPTDVYRAVHFLRDNAFFFAGYAKEFFYRTHRLLQERRVIEVRRLLVYSGKEELGSTASQRIIRFHACVPGYAYRLIAVQDYARIRQAYDIHPAIDFGIFGEKRVFRARSDRPDFVIGTWSSKKSEVRRYIHLFEACWTSSSASELESASGEPMTLDQLFSQR